jgi:hypothetical protein
MNSFSNFEIIYIFHRPLYCDMGNEIIQCVTYDNYDNFQHVNVIFSSQNFISLF